MVKLRSMTRAARSAESENAIAQDQAEATGSTGRPPKRKALAEVNAPNNASATVAIESPSAAKRSRTEPGETTDAQQSQEEAATHNNKHEQEQQELAQFKQDWLDGKIQGENPRLVEFASLSPEEKCRTLADYRREHSLFKRQRLKKIEEDRCKFDKILREHARARDKVEDKIEQRIQERVRNIPMRDCRETRKMELELTLKLLEANVKIGRKELEQLKAQMAAMDKHAEDARHHLEEETRYMDDLGKLAKIFDCKFKSN